MDEKELQAVSDALEELRRGGTLSAETLGKLGTTSDSVNKALEGYTKKLLGAGSAVGGFAQQVAAGEGAFKSLGGAMSGFASAIGKVAGALPIIGGAARALADGVGEAAKFVLDQLDTMAANQQTLGDASAGAVDGITGLKRQFDNLGNFSLPGFAKAVKANVQGIAALGGTAALGAEQLAKVAGSLTTGGTAEKFLKLGMSLESVGEATAQYLSDTARLGLNQGASTEELTKKTQNYIVEVDKIARLTGQTREAQAKEAQKTMVDVRFRAKLAEMAASGQGAQAEELKKFVEGLGGAAGDAARAMALGIPLTKEAAEANIFSNDAIRQNTESLKSGEKLATTAIADTQQALADGAKTFGTLLMVGKDLGGVGIQALEAEALLERRNALVQTGLSREDAIAQAQKEQMESRDKATQGFTAAQLATAGASKDLQSLGFTLALVAIPAVDKFSAALKKVTGFIDEKFGSGKSDGAGSSNLPSDAAAQQSAKQKMRELIGKGESENNYNALVYGKKGANTPRTADLTGMTIAQVQEYQKGMTSRGHDSTAVGKYQIKQETLAAQVKKAELDVNTTKFDQKTQDLLADQLIDQAGFGKKDTATVMNNLAGTFASLPKDMSGKGRYDGFNKNRATIDPTELRDLIDSANRPAKEIAISDKLDIGIATPVKKAKETATPVDSTTEIAAVSGPVRDYKPSLSTNNNEAMLPVNTSSTASNVNSDNTSNLLNSVNQAVSLLTELVQTERSAMAYQRQIMHNSKV